MGLSSSSKTQTTKPIYAPQIEGAANTVTGAYNAAAPGIAQSASEIGGLVPGLIDKFKAGDPNIKAAEGYNTDVLSGKYLSGNPYLDQMISTTNADTRNGLAASLGTRGLTGGSDFAGIITNALAKNEGNLRYSNYNDERTRMGQASALAPSLAGADYLPLTAAISAAQAQQAPVQTAAGYGSTIGGLLGQYTNQKQTSSPSLMDSIGQALNIAKTVAGFF